MLILMFNFSLILILNVNFYNNTTINYYAIITYVSLERILKSWFWS